MRISRSTLHFVVYVFLILGVLFLGKVMNIDLDQIRMYLAQYPLWISGGLFILIYVGLTTLLWVGTIDLFRTTGALLFGPYWSTLFVYIAEILNASILFLLSRKLGREFVEQKFHLKTDENKYHAGGSGFWTATVLRMNPLVPFRFMDVGFGLSSLSFRKYFWAVVLGSPLRIFWLQFAIAGMGEAVLKDPKIMLNYFQDNPAAMVFSGLYFLVVMIFSLVVFIGNFRKRRTLQCRLSNLK